MSVEISEGDAQEAFEQFSSVRADKWENANADELAERLADAGYGDLDSDDVTSGIRVLGRVAQEYDRETFVETVQSGEVPPLELSAEEMQTVRGGAALTLAAAAIIVCTPAM